MSKMIINQRVEDFTKFKTLFDSVNPLRRQFGCTGEEIYRSLNNTNEMVIITHWKNQDQAHKYAQSPELIDLMNKGGVSGLPNIYYVE